MSISKVPSISKKILAITVKSLKETVNIIAAGDFHVGAETFNKQAFKEFIKRLQKMAKREKVYLILMGDLFDAISVMGDKRFHLRERDYRNQTMDDCITFLADAFKPLLKTKNFHFVGAISGNHELKYSMGDIQPIYRLYRETDIEPLGSKSYIWFKLKHGKKTKTLRTIAFHGARSSYSDIGKTKAVRDFLKENDMTYTDHIRLNKIIFYGHTHGCQANKIERIIANPEKECFYQMEQWACLTGSFADTANFRTNSYAAKRGLCPTPVGYIHTRVSMANSHIDVKAETNHGLNPDVKQIGWDE